MPDATPAQPPGHARFAGTSAEFQADADLLLQLHDGAHLPAHSALLASMSPVLCKMLKLAASETPAGSKMVLPLTDFTEQEAAGVLTARVPGQDHQGHGQTARSLRTHLFVSIRWALSAWRAGCAAAHVIVRRADVAGRLPCDELRGVDRQEAFAGQGGAGCRHAASAGALALGGQVWRWRAPPACRTLFARGRAAHGHRARPRASVKLARTGTAPARALRQRPGLLQDDMKHVKSIDYDILFECWAVADRLNVHALAADCEWAMTVLWSAEGVHMRAVLELSRGALQRIARSLGALCAGARAAREEVWNSRNCSQYAKTYLDYVGKHLSAAETPAATMLQWRMGEAK